MAKKIISILLLVVVLGGCSKKSEIKVEPTDKIASTMEPSQEAVKETSSDGIDIDITEDLYVYWINEIYTNPEDYLGKTIRIQGMYTEELDVTNDNTYTYVYRQGPGCCGNDGGMCGFEFQNNGTKLAENDWIEVVGELIQYKDGGTYLALKADSVTIKEERGIEVLPQ